MTGLRRALTGVGAAVAVVLGAFAASAAPVVGVSIDATDATTGVSGGSYAIDLATTANPDGTYGLSGIGYGAAFQCNWDLTVNTDPQITSNFTLKNLAGTTQNFVMTITLPIATIAPNTVQGGYYGDPVNGTTYSDTSGDGNVTLSSVGSFYQALVNSVVSQSLGTFSVSSATFASLPQQQWGTPIPSAPFGAATNNMQIRWSFSLTPGDTVQSKGFFQVEAPEPGSVVLVGLGLAALGLVRRRSA
jgi:PEP-CTERM motif-containing protein